MVGGARGGLCNPGNAGEAAAGDKDAYPAGSPALRLPPPPPLPRGRAGGAQRFCRVASRCRPPAASGGRGGDSRGKAAPLTAPPAPLPPQEPESPEATQFRLAAGRVPEVPFGLSTSAAVLSHYGVAANTITLFRRVRGSAAWGGVGGTGTEEPGSYAEVAAAAPRAAPSRENTLPCKELCVQNSGSVLGMPLPAGCGGRGSKAGA